MARTEAISWFAGLVYGWDVDVNDSYIGFEIEIEQGTRNQLGRAYVSQ